jgi:hypothetical protein
LSKPMFDADSLISMFEGATAKQGEQLRKATTEATLAALNGRELTLKNIRAALKQVADAAGTGLAKNVVTGVDPEALLDKAVSGMDEALLKAVEANRVALSTLTAQGADLREKHLAKALDDLDKMEDAMFSALKKSASGAAAPMAGAWGQVLEKMQAGGTLSGAQAASTAEQMAEQMQTAMRSTRAASLKAAQALAESYTAMVSGVLLGMSDALQSGGAAKKTGRK